MKSYVSNHCATCLRPITAPISPINAINRSSFRTKSQNRGLSRSTCPKSHGQSRGLGHRGLPAGPLGTTAGFFSLKLCFSLSYKK